MDLVRQFADIGKSDLETAGGKGANLGELTSAGFPVPPGFVLITEAYRTYVRHNIIEAAIIDAARRQSDDPAILQAAADKIATLFAEAPIPVDLNEAIIAGYHGLGDGVRVAVRSSATAEDLAEASFAGQQDTYLNIRGDDALLDAVRRCWASLWTARAIAYRARQGIDPADVSLAVVVQEMIESEASGVMFTANPANGRRDQTVIAAAWGLGEAIVSGAVNTDDLVVDASGAVIDRHTADKELQTTYVEHGTAELPVPEDRRRLAVLDDAAAAELAALGGRIRDHYGAPQDIEWARRDGRFFIVQARPITALPEETGDVPFRWDVPEERSWYFRASIVEQLPDPLTPLFGDLIDGAVSRSLSAMFTELLGEDSLQPGDIRFPMINGYAFYQYRIAAFRRVLTAVPTALKALSGRSGFVERWRDEAHPAYRRIVADWTARDLDRMSAADLYDGVGVLLEAGASYYTVVQTIIPPAASSETVLTRFYDSAVRRPGDPAASTLLLGYDSMPIRSEKSLYDLSAWAADRPELKDWLLNDQADGEPADAAEFRRRFHDHLARFGHTTYNLDFAQPVPADDPDPVLDSLRFFLSGQGADPHRRQAAAAERRDRLVREIEDRLDPARRSVFQRLVAAAQRFAPIREDALADVGLAWPRLRQLLGELGRRLAADGVIDEADQVFWLRDRELKDWLSGETLGSRTDDVARRKAVWRGQRLATPPQMLPDNGWAKFFARWMPAVSGNESGPVLRGIGASAGSVTAPARVLGGPADFGDLQPGDVLVASITTPAWTSLFAKASAVVTDIGGPLSHSSIVAREYGIPAVLGTGSATRRIHSGEQITVDGDGGKVILVEQPGAALEPSDDHRKSRAPVIVGIAAAVGVVALIWRHHRRRHLGH
ncbi:PEP/pyruvate-binding domain-containing protein [Microlunatus speluncae]|uniref:PEP/pyruvate-binding domain-containing protein n=1 Tax=Microlunatus speluncae TaxID=2594267 RepID=UPI00126613D1|nr:PEP/pyruvate-binding domain-containing protein [Microlunatus speluncae]